jgi:chromosome segregation ATPase
MKDHAQRVNAVFEWLEVMKKEQGFLRGLVGTMVDDGEAASDQLESIRIETETLTARREELEQELAVKRSEINQLDQQILIRNETLAGDTNP